VEPEEAEDVEAEPEPAVVSEEAEAEPEAEPEDYEIVEEVVVEYDEEPATFEEAVPEGDAFERGLESLISGETAPGPTEEVPVLEPEPEAEPDQALEPEPVVAQAEERVALPLDDRPPAAPPPTGSEITAAGLVKRTPKKQAASTVGGGPLRTASTISRPTSGHSHRSPEEVRKMLSRYRGGLKRGRQGGDEPSSGA
jgi:hypothetical protein